MTTTYSQGQVLPERVRELIEESEGMLVSDFIDELKLIVSLE